MTNIRKRFALVLSYHGIEREISYHESYDEAIDAWNYESESDPLPNYWIKELSCGTENEKISILDNLSEIKSFLISGENLNGNRIDLASKLDKNIKHLKELWDFL